MQLQLTSLEPNGVACRIVVSEQEAQTQQLPRHTDGCVKTPLFEDEFHRRGFAWDPEMYAWVQRGNYPLIRIAAIEIAHEHGIPVK